jgi:tetratricopeptide (TPR) repeat protein
MKAILHLLLIVSAFSANAQFHTLMMPKSSPKATVTQQIGVTTVRVSYGSPSIRGRNVWENSSIIPQNGKPIAWRAGANENTVIQFDTDVFIEGEKLSAGSYGFHIIPNGHEHTILFAKKDNLWGSYYLDVENDVALRVNVTDTICPFSEHLGFEFSDRTENSAIISLKWGDRSIPFQFSVNLIQTTLDKFRYELNGENTYRWKAWNDAAAWCLQQNTNLEEALSWVNRSIQGGYGGFGQNYNLTNFATKIRILKALNRADEMSETFDQAMELCYSIDEAHIFGGALIELKEEEKATQFFKKALMKYKDEWGIQYMISIAYYYQNDLPKAKKYLKMCGQNAPDFFSQRVEITLNEMINKTYIYPNRS